MRGAGAVAWAVAVVAASGSTACSRSPAPLPERYLPADADWAIVVPKLRAAQEGAGPALKTLLTFPAAAELGEVLAAVRAQLGFDPLDPRALSQAGIDPDGGAGLAAWRAGPLVLALPTADADRVMDLVARLARDRLSAGLRGESDVGGTRVTLFHRAAGAPPVIAFARLRGMALLAPGEEGARAVAAAAALPQGNSLAASTAFAKARAALASGPLALAFSPSGSPALARLPLARDGMALALLASSLRIEVRAALLLPEGRAKAWRAALPEGAANAGGDAVGRMPEDAFLALRSGLDPAVVARRFAMVAPQLAARFAEAGVDLERDVGAALAPGAAVGISLAPTFQVSAISRGGLAAAEQDPFRLVHVAAVLDAKDGDRVAALFDRLGRAAPALGLRVERRPVAGLAGWRVARGAAAVAFALDGKRLYAAAGPGRLDALLARRAGAYAAPTASSRAALDGAAAAALLDLGRLVRSFRALPPEAYGTGPDAFVMRSLAERVVDPAARLSAASLRLDGAEGIARLDLVVEAAAGEGR